MRGTILGTHDSRGVLVGPGETRLEFPLTEWRSPGTPVAGQVVDYVEAEGEARGVFAVPGAAMAAGTSASTSFLLGAFSVGCLAFGFVIPLFPTIAAFVLGVIGAARAKLDGDETGLLLSRIGWIGALVYLGIGVIVLLGLAIFAGTIVALSGFSLGPTD
jgi:hypothetical protein